MAARRVSWFRVLGMGEISGIVAYSYLWSTEAASASWTLPSGCIAALVYPTLLDAPDLPSSTIAPLDAIGGDGGVTVNILHGPASSEPLTRGIVGSFASSGGTARLTEYAEPSDTTWKVDDSAGFTSLPRLAYSGREAVVVTAIGSGTLTVVRAACSSIAQPFPLTRVGYTYTGSAIFNEPPGPVGLWCEVGYSEYGGAATTTWRGVVEAVEVGSNRVVSISARGIVADLRDRKLTTPTASFWLDVDRYYRALPIGSDGGTFSGSLVTTANGARPIVVDADQWGEGVGDAVWEYARVILDDGRWVVVPCAYDATYTAFGVRRAFYLLQESYTPTEIVQVGDADGVLDLRAGELAEHVQAVIAARIDRLIIEYARVSTGAASGVIYDWLTASEPVGWGGAIPSAWLDMSAIDYTSGSIGLPVNDLAQSSWVYTRADGRKFLDALAADLLEPLGYGIASDAGSLVAIDWSPDTRTAAATFGDAAARAVAWRWRRVSWEGSRQAVLLQGRALSVVVNGSRADPRGLLAGVQAISLAAWSDVSIADGGPVLQRQSAIVSLYGQSLPDVTLSIDASVAVAVGQVVQVTRSDLVARDGSVGSPECRGLVIERDRAQSSDVVGVRVLLIGWIDDVVARWGPSGSITSGTGTTAVIAAAVYSADDATPWTLVTYPDEVRILDASGAEVDTGTATGFNAGTRTLTITGLGGAPSAGEIVTLGPYSTAASANKAEWIWLADTDGTVGSSAGYPWGA